MKLSLLETSRDLINFTRQIHSQSWIAIDTEFERVNTYYPELCLVQIHAGDKTVLIDPLAIDDLQPLHDILSDTSITKVFHSARQDLEVFYNQTKSVPEPVFDTQIAASLVGFDDQIGYANLVRQMLDIDLPKTETRTNWKQRPLTDKQKHYAADDVIHLATLYEKCRSLLQQQNKQDECEQRCEALLNTALYEPDPQLMWKKVRIRDVSKLNSQQKQSLKKLAAWREQTARKANRPRKWIMKDHTLFELARDCPEDRDGLRKIRDLGDKTINRYSQQLLQLIHE